MTTAANISFKNSTAWISLLNLVYPVGSLYFSSNNTSPANRFGGTWSQLTNAVVRAYNGWGYTGSDTHAITVNEMPKHYHPMSQLHLTGSGGTTSYHSSWWHNDSNTEETTGYAGGARQCPYFHEGFIVTPGIAQPKSIRGEAA